MQVGNFAVRQQRSMTAEHFEEAFVPAIADRR
jgi:hypothetical protein